MVEHKYRGQLIRLIATQPRGSKYWVARADVRYLDRNGLRLFSLKGSRSQFTTNKAAQIDLIKEAKNRIDTLTKL
jgi:hypothetical protein